MHGCVLVVVSEDQEQGIKFLKLKVQVVGSLLIGMELSFYVIVSEVCAARKKQAALTTN